MSNIQFFKTNQWASGTITYTTQHPSFPATNLQERRLTNVWRSNYEIGGGHFEITTSNQKLYFDEGGGTLTATIATGTYDADALAGQIESHMEAAGAHSYTVNFKHGLKKFRITDDTGTFELLGTSSVNAIWDTIGYDASDTGFAAVHTADNIRIHTHEYVQSTLSAAVNFTGIWVYNYNVQTTGIMKLQFSNDSFVTTPLEVSLARNGLIVAAYLSSTVQSYDDMRLYIEDNDNPDGYVQAGLCFVGEGYQPQNGFKPKFSERPIDNSIINEAISGEVSSIQYPHIEARNYKFDPMNPFDDFQAVFDAVGYSKPMIVLTRELIVSSNTFSNPELYTLYCRIKKGGWNKQHAGGKAYGLSLSLIEEK
jgi:hypothetical protein